MSCAARLRAWWVDFVDIGQQAEMVDADSHLTRSGQTLPEDVGPHSLPQPGEQWRLNDGDPFPPKSVVEIREVQAGWVRYAFVRVSGISGLSGLLNDERMLAIDFCRIYRRHAPTETAAR